MGAVTGKMSAFQLHYVGAFWYNVERYGGSFELILAPACLAGRGHFAAPGRSVKWLAKRPFMVRQSFDRLRTGLTTNG